MVFGGSYVIELTRAAPAAAVKCQVGLGRGAGVATVCVDAGDRGSGHRSKKKNHITERRLTRHP